MGPLICLSTALVNAAESGATNTRIRVGDTRVVEVFEHGLARSPSFRELIATLESVGRIVEIEHGTCQRSPGDRCPHSLPMVSAASVLVTVDAQPPIGAAVGRLAHGLYHALEIAREQGVVDVDSSRRLFARIGERPCQHDSDACWETRAATAFEALVIRELSGLEPVLPPNVQFTDSDSKQVAGGLLQASPTFRRQCAIVGATEELTVLVGRPMSLLPFDVRGRTLLQRYSTGLVIARVELPVLTNPSLLAHEFEHVLEYMEHHARIRSGEVSAAARRVLALDSNRVRAAEHAARRELSEADRFNSAIGRLLDVVK